MKSINRWQCLYTYHRWLVTSRWQNLSTTTQQYENCDERTLHHHLPLLNFGYFIYNLALRARFMMSARKQCINLWNGVEGSYIMSKYVQITPFTYWIGVPMVELDKCMASEQEWSVRFWLAAYILGGCKSRDHLSITIANHQEYFAHSWLKLTMAPPHRLSEN